MAKYSVCMTCFNESATVEESMLSLLNQLDERFDVTVVDNFSSDGTYDSLLELRRKYGVNVIRKQCTRGKGRQIAFENSTGEYVIANLDLDDVFLPVLKDIVAGYHRLAEGRLLAAFNSPPTGVGQGGWSQNMTIGPRHLIQSLGGWRDLNIYEDWDIWSRAGRAGSYLWTSFKFAKNQTSPGERRRVHDRLATRYGRYRDRLRLGLKVFSPGEQVGPSQRMAYAAARLMTAFGPKFSGQDPKFDSFRKDYFVDMGPTAENGGQ